MDKRLVPYNVYLHAEHVDKLKQMAGKRQASSVVRDAISMMMDGKDTYNAGYNKGIKEAIKLIDGCKDIQMIAIGGKYLADILIDQLEGLEK